jgi:hypothetical protein
MLLSIFDNALKRPNAIWDEIVRLQIVQILQMLVKISSGRSMTNIVIDANRHIFSPILLFLYKSSS